MVFVALAAVTSGPAAPTGTRAVLDTASSIEPRTPRQARGCGFRDAQVIEYDVYVKELFLPAMQVRDRGVAHFSPAIAQ